MIGDPNPTGSSGKRVMSGETTERVIDPNSSVAPVAPAPPKKAKTALQAARAKKAEPVPEPPPAGQPRSILKTARDPNATESDQE